MLDNTTRTATTTVSPGRAAVGVPAGYPPDRWRRVYRVEPTGVTSVERTGGAPVKGQGRQSVHRMSSALSQRARAMRHCRSGRGQGLVEFALVSPLLFLLIFAIIQFGVAIVQRSALSFAVRQGVRVASIHGAEPTANDQICAALRQGLSSSGANPDNVGLVTIFKGAQPGLNAANNDNTHTHPDPYLPGVQDPDSHDVGGCTAAGWSYSVPGGVIGWPYQQRNVVDPPDPIGVAITYNFRFILPMFGTGLTWSDASILNIEPQFARGSIAGVTGPTPAPLYTQVPYPTGTPYPIQAPYPTGTPYPTLTPAH